MSPSVLHTCTHTRLCAYAHAHTQMHTHTHINTRINKKNILFKISNKFLRLPLLMTMRTRRRKGQ